MKKAFVLVVFLLSFVIFVLNIGCKSKDDVSPKGMALIPKGWFYMGCVPDDSQCSDNEKPRKRVYVDSFYMDIHEVTVGDYRKCVQAGVCKEARVSGAGAQEWNHYYNWDKVDRSDQPINGVDWNDATAYCHWKGKRLPSEAEFEYALRGGSDGYKYPWGKSATPPSYYGNFADETLKGAFSSLTIISGYDDGYVGTAPVCSMQRNSYGLCDISGNVWEWCSDWYDNDWYSKMTEQNPINTNKNSDRVFRGSSWNNPSEDLRASTRNWVAPTFGYHLLGFRCSRDK